MAKRKRPDIPPLSGKEAQRLSKTIDDAAKDFAGIFETLESAAGMLMIGRLYGWKVITLMHNKRTIKKYEEILGIDIREEFNEEEGPLSYRCVAYEMTKNFNSFWKAVSGEFKIDRRREITKD